MITMQNLTIPDLDHDAKMLAQFGTKVSPTGRRERRIVAALIAHLAEHGWTPSEVSDGDETTKATDAKSAMELIFNLDYARLFVTKDTQTHWVFLVLGNDTDIISDWGFNKGDSDGFNAVMDAFDADVFA